MAMEYVLFLPCEIQKELEFEGLAKMAKVSFILETVASNVDEYLNQSGCDRVEDILVGLYFRDEMRDSSIPIVPLE